jgi:hypothetical protein
MADYSYYFGKLQGLPMMAYVDDPQPGFFRDRDGTPIAFFPAQAPAAGAAFDIPTTEGKILGVKYVKGTAGAPLVRRDLSDDEAMRLWSWCCADPVKESDWRKVVAGGEWFDDAPGLGHNSPEQEETVEQRAERLLRLANEWLERHPDALETKAEADQAAHYITDLRRTASDLADREKAEAKPYRDFIAQIKLRFGTQADALFAVSEKLKTKAADFIKRQKALAEAEAKRIADEERKREAERRAAEAAGRPAPAPPPPRSPAPKPTQIGGRGRKVFERTTYSAEIVDYEVALASCMNDLTIKDAVKVVADRAARASMVGRKEPDLMKVLPGTKVVADAHL